MSKALSKAESIDNGINVAEIASIEERSTRMTEQFRKNQIDRMQVGKCSDEGCVLYSRCSPTFGLCIGETILNVGQEMAGGKRIIISHKKNKKDTEIRCPFSLYQIIL